MRRNSYYKVKQEAETTFRNDDHDLAYYIHDRVELMHQVFSVLKSKELKSLAPHCVRHISIDDLQELCLEEVLGISSKRLCAILDGAEPPSDTESSSASDDRLETISLDSISSNDDILSCHSSKKNKKHRHKTKNKSKRKRKKSKEDGATEVPDGPTSAAGRAGLTALELLELTARARAIRAQLQSENNKRAQEAGGEPGCSRQSSDNEVEIKEEQPEVVEISSEDEKPKVEELDRAIAHQLAVDEENAATVTKRINNLIVTVPKRKTTNKVKLKRSKPTSITNNNSEPIKNNMEKDTLTVRAELTKQSLDVVPVEDNEKCLIPHKETKDKSKKKQKKKEKRKIEKEKDGSDHDEITLQLSDSEKMDLLEDFDRKKYSRVSSSSSEDTESSSSDSDEMPTSSVKSDIAAINPKVTKNSTTEKDTNNCIDSATSSTHNDNPKISTDIELSTEEKRDEEIIETNSNAENQLTHNADKNEDDKLLKESLTETPTSINDNIINKQCESKQIEPQVIEIESDVEKNQSLNDSDNPYEKNDKNKEESQPLMDSENLNEKNDINKKELSEGELSDSDSSTVEICDPKPDVVCISDDNTTVSKKTKHKKQKKSKNDTNLKISTSDCIEIKDNDAIEISSKKVAEESDDVYEIFDLSDDSSCYEIGGVSVLSKEPTAEEIQALSEQIDEIERGDVVTDEDIQRYEKANEQLKNQENEENIGNVSWRDRYLGSKKVKRVLNVSNMFNALRKKNKELKKQIEESKKLEMQATSEESRTEKEEVPTENVEEGTIEQYETLESLTKYVDPVPEPSVSEVKEIDSGENQDGKVTKEMKKDAKLLLKMYKKLLKYNDINKPKDPNKKKKKKRKKAKANEKVKSDEDAVKANSA